MSDQSDAPERGEPTPAQPAEQTQQPAEPPAWLGPIEQRMNELRDQNVEVAERLSALTAPEEEVEDLLPEDEWYDDNGDLTPEAAQQIIDQRVQEAVSARWSEQQATEALSLRELAFDELRERLPDLADDAYSTQIVREVAADLQAQGHEAIINTPMFVDLIEQRHKALKFDEQAASMAEQAPQRVVLEAGGGASAQQRAQPQEDWGERIVKAAERLRPQI